MISLACKHVISSTNSLISALLLFLKDGSVKSIFGFSELRATCRASAHPGTLRAVCARSRRSETNVWSESLTF